VSASPISELASTEMIVYHEGAVVHSAVIPIGGDHFTSDLTVGLATPGVEAEKDQAHLWQRSGHAHSRSQRSRGSFRWRPSVAHGGTAFSSAKFWNRARSRTLRDDAAESAAVRLSRYLLRRLRAQRWRYATGGNSGLSRNPRCAARCGLSWADAEWPRCPVF